ncbi:MAG: alpha/beta fold hydrolase [Proteobacteria bacterium]|nr:alpha/beta fold hydrolase [Pseudomonadota bacterium]
MAVLNRGGVDLYYEVHGQGPALLLTHGYSATSQMWRSQIDALSKHHTLILWDMRGHGLSDSPRDDAAYSESLTTGDMAALLQHLNFESAIIGGLSLGGYMSLAFYADYPKMVDGLLIIDTGPGFKNDAAREAWNRTAIARAEAIDEGGASALEGRSAEQASAEHRDITGLVYAARNMLTQYTPRVIQSLPAIDVPTVVLVGADDEPFLAATDYMALKIPGVEKVIIAEAGHASNIDQPLAFNEAILGFLSRHHL